MYIYRKSCTKPEKKEKKEGSTKLNDKDHHYLPQEYKNLRLCFYFYIYVG